MPEAAGPSPQAEGQLHTGVHDDVVGHARPGIEAPGIALRPVLIAGLGIVAFTAAMLFGLRLYYRHAVPGPLLQTPRAFPAPRLQQNPESDLAAMLGAQRARLNGYGWVDRDRGIARMPIGEAMRRLAERGNDAYSAPIQPEAWPPLGSRGGAASSLPSPQGTPGAPPAPPHPASREGQP